MQLVFWSGRSAEYARKLAVQSHWSSEAGDRGPVSDLLLSNSWGVPVSATVELAKLNRTNAISRVSTLIIHQVFFPIPTNCRWTSPRDSQLGNLPWPS